MQVQDPQPFKNFTPPAPSSEPIAPAQHVPGHHRALWAIGTVLILIVVGGIIYQSVVSGPSVKVSKSDQAEQNQYQADQAKQLQDFVTTLEQSPAKPATADETKKTADFVANLKTDSKASNPDQASIDHLQQVSASNN